MQAPQKRGFALLVTVVLLAFLVLLLVSLASLTRVETQVAANSQQVTQARQNALLGLNIAIGQLQKYAGPDQRVTATADLNSTAVNPRYTGVWNVAAVNASAKTNRPLAPSASSDTDSDNTTVFKPTPLPEQTKPDVWLVSGNETAPIAIDYKTDTSDANTFVTLVGANTATDTVRTAKVAITATAATGIVGNVTIGKYAYWVGDEGVKAKLNVTDPYTPRPAADAQTPAVTPTDIQTYHRKAVAQRYGIEQMALAGDNNITLGSAYAPTANTTTSAALIRDLGKVFSYSNAQLTAGIPSAFFKNRYWDLTASGYGLLTDTANGGLKYDLTWDLSQAKKAGLKTGAITSPVTWIPASAPPQTGAIWYPSGTSLTTISNNLDPQWDVLRDFYRLNPALSPSRFSGNSVILQSSLPLGTGSIAVPGNGARTNHPTMPVFVQARIYYGVQANPDGTVSGQDYVLFLVANPYDMSLSVPNGLSFHINPYPGDIFIKATTMDGSVYGGASGTATFDQIPGNGWLTASSPLTFAPGEVKAFALSQNVTGGGSTPAPLTELTPSNPSVINNAISFPLTKSTTGSGPANNTIRTATVSFPLSGSGSTAINYSGYCIFDMYSNTGNQHLAVLKYIPYQLPSGSGTQVFTNSGGENPFTVGGSVFSLKMPAEIGYAANTSIRFLADYNNRVLDQGSYRADMLTSYYFYYQPSADTFSTNTAPATWGLSSSTQTGGNQNAILYHIPRPPAGAPSWAPVIMSIADLQHANITTTAQEPTYAIGNSYASVFCQPERSVSVPQPDITPNGQGRTNPSWRYDMSYLCNEALWDGYYFSTVPQPGIAGSTYAPQTDSLPNSRHVPIVGPAGLPTWANLTASASSAAALLRINGAFNVNSTSVEAWKAVFSSLRGLDHGGDSNLTGPFFRTLWQTGGSANAQTGRSNNSWTGFRNLSADEINALATQMVAQVRLRGPFRSLGDFVNRRLLAASADPNGLRLRGALQAAIDDAGINSQFDSTGTTTKGNDTAAAYASQTNASDPSLQWMTPDNAVGNRATGAPGWLMQSDVLQAVGASLSDRSDTFTIRSYGEVINPATGSTDAKAWCEAVVQRFPEYVDTTDTASVAPAALTQTINKIFGRRFKIVGFRWLGPNDI